MATKKRTTTKKATRKKSTSSTNKKNKQNKQELERKLIIKNEIIGVLILFFGMFLLYSLLSKESGSFGSIVNTISMFLFGNMGTIIVGLSALVLSCYILMQLKPFEEGVTLISVIVILLNILASFNIDGMYQKYSMFDKKLFDIVYTKVTSGGILGIWLGNIYTKLLSNIGSYIFIVAVIIVCLILIFRDNIALYKENRVLIKEKERAVKQEIREEKLTQKIAKREEQIRNSNSGESEPLFKRILKNPYEKEDKIVTSEDKEQVLDKWEKEYKGSLNPFKLGKKKDPIINTYNDNPDVNKKEDKFSEKEILYAKDFLDKDEIKEQIRKEQGFDDIIRDSEAEQEKTKSAIERTKLFLGRRRKDENKYEDNIPYEELERKEKVEKIDLSDLDKANEVQRKQIDDLKELAKGGRVSSDDSTDSLVKGESAKVIGGVVLEEGKVATKPYVYPSVNLLKKAKSKNTAGEKDIVLKNTKILEETLANFKIGANVTEVSVGPTVTRYELQLEPGIKVSKVVGLQDNLAMALAARGIRIEAPIPGKSAIGVEVPNKEVSIVSFKEIVDTPKFNNSKSKLSVALGKNVTGEEVIMDIAKMPHLLIAGATGSGKSVCINAIINSILFHASPEEVRLILIDPKMVELNVYEGIPHLLVPVETNPNHAAGALKWAEKQMEARYRMFAGERVKDIKSYNKKMEETGGEKMPQWVIIIDELADLMMTCASQVEEAICRLAQLARAAGIHLVLATQRPSVDVITGLIKANITSRISFAVSSSIDSRTILDMAGAEKLLGRGDMLYNPSGVASPIRAQCAYISDEEVERIVASIKENAISNYDEEAIKGIQTVSAEENMPKNGNNNINDEDSLDEKFNDAVNIAFELGEVSTSMLQRKLRIGYARAGRIVDEMEQRGIVSMQDGSKPRKILMKRDEFFADRMLDNITNDLDLEYEEEE